MPGVPIGPVARHVARLYGEGTVSGLSESQLLDRFLARNDAAAFEALVARHGPMVLAVCRRVLRDAHAADDAFQATFLLLVRKAGSIRGTDLLGPWLHRVAYRVSVRLSKAESRRRGRETTSPEAVALAPNPDRPGPELRLALHEALDALPEKLRAPVVLCYLEGRTHDEAARRLDWPIGSVKGRLSRARSILKDRLSRRGVLIPSGAILAGLAREASAAVPALLRDSTVRAASSLAAGRSLASSGAISATAAALTQEAARSMLIKKLGALAASVAALFLMVGGAAVVARQDGKLIDAKGAVAKTDDAKPAEPKNDLDRLQGRWERIRVDRGGNSGILEPVSPYSLREIVIADQTLSGVGDDDQPAFPRTMILDPSTSPKQFTWRRAAAGGAQETTRGIYKLEDEIFTLCYDVNDPAHPPQDFRTQSGDGRTTSVYRRARSAAEPSPEMKAELNELQGNWGPVARETNGEQVPLSNSGGMGGGPIERVEFSITGNRLREFMEGRESLIRLDLQRSPRMMELRQPPNVLRALAQQGRATYPTSRLWSYKRDGDDLVICVDQGAREADAPPELVTRPNDGRVLTVYKRAKPPQTAPPAAETLKAVEAKPGHERTDFDGRWVIDRVVRDGKSREYALEPRFSSFEIKSGNVTPTNGRQPVGPSPLSFSVDDARTPGVMTWTDPSRPGKPTVYAFAFDGNAELGPIRMCMNADPGKRKTAPGVIASRPGDGLLLLVVKRMPDTSHKTPDPPRRVARKVSDQPRDGAEAGANDDGQETGLRVALRHAERASQLQDRRDGLREMSQSLQDQITLLRDRFRDAEKLLSEAELSRETGVTFGPRILAKPGSDEEAQMIDKLRKSLDDRKRRLDSMVRDARDAERKVEALDREIASERAKADSAGRRPGRPGAVQPGDLLVIEVLEALPGRPISGERVVRPDGTISLGFYGDLKVEGLTRKEIKIGVVEHMQKYLVDDALGLRSIDEDGKQIQIAPEDSDRVFVDDSLNYERPRGDRSAMDLEKKLEAISRELEVIRALTSRKTNPGP